AAGSGGGVQGQWGGRGARCVRGFWAGGSGRPPATRNAGGRVCGHFGFAATAGFAVVLAVVVVVAGAVVVVFGAGVVAGCSGPTAAARSAGCSTDDSYGDASSACPACG